MGFGDDMLRFNGIGERITVGDEQQRPADATPTRTQYYRDRALGGASAGWR